MNKFIKKFQQIEVFKKLNLSIYNIWYIYKLQSNNIFLKILPFPDKILKFLIISNKYEKI